MIDEALLPISVRWEDGTIDTYDDVDSLETDLEVFDSESTPECEVRDRLGRRVRLKVDDWLVLKELFLLEQEPDSPA
jgi:hypothetical protein